MSASDLNEHGWAAEALPPRKGVTAWEIEPMEENGDEFFVLTFHHGLGRMTRLDLWREEVEDVARTLTDAVRNSATPRKRTAFKLCERHAHLAADGRRRMAENFGEGGPAGSPCTGDTCKIRPGTDLFAEDWCRQREWYDTAGGDHPFVWPANKKKEDA